MSWGGGAQVLLRKKGDGGGRSTGPPQDCSHETPDHRGTRVGVGPAAQVGGPPTPHPAWGPPGPVRPARKSPVLPTDDKRGNALWE